jgi:hypothetical protein
MRFGDVFDPQKGPEAILRLALYPLGFVVALQLIAEISSRMTAGDFLLLLLFLALVSPLAYCVREARRGRPHRLSTRRGAERTPWLPFDREDV